MERKLCSMKNSNRIFAMRAMYFIICGAPFIVFQNMSIYLQSLAFTNDVSVGLIMSLGYLVTTLTQPIWGVITDHAATKNRVLRITILGLAASLWLLILPKHKSYLTLIPSVSLIYVFLSIPMMLIDTIVVESLDGGDVPFGTVRCFSSGGASAVAFTMYLLSLAVKLKPATTFIIAFFSAVFSLIPLHFLPVTKGHAHGIKGDKEKVGLKAILKNRRLVLLLCYILFLFTGVQATNVFLGVFYATDKGMNAGIGMYGLYYAICIAIETCLMLFGNRIWSKIDIYGVFLLVGVSAAARSLTIYLAQNLYVLQLSAIFHVLLYAPLWSCLTPYVNSIVTKEMRATGQAAWTIMSAGIGPMLGSTLGGIVSDHFGLRNLFMAAAVWLFIMAVVFFFLFRRQRASEKTELTYICNPS